MANSVDLIFGLRHLIKIKQKLAQFKLNTNNSENLLKFWFEFFLLITSLPVLILAPNN